MYSFVKGTTFFVISKFFLKLFQKYEEDGEDEAGEGYEMVPLQGLAFEHDCDHEGEDSERDHFLDYLQLHKVERSAVAVETDAVSGYLCAVFEERHTP